MRRPRSYGSWLAPDFRRYVALRRATGARYEWQEYRLRAFDRYLTEEAPRPPLARETLLRYLALLDGLTPQARDNVVCVLWPALRHALRHGAPIGPLPPRPPRPPQHIRQRRPRLVTPEEVERLVSAARRLTPRAALRPATLATLIGLLYTTGMRIGEALLPALSTYLGHVSVEGTRQYLIANGGLLEQAGARFERWTRALDEVAS